MKKVAFLLIALLLVACNATVDPSAAPADDPAAASTTEQSEEAETEPEDVGETAVSSNDEFNIATTPEEAGIVRDRDWVKGATDPKVTIIEYGDFQ